MKKPYTTKRKVRLRRQGMCPACGFPKEDDGFVQCERCRNENKEAHKKRRGKALRNKVCTRCFKNKTERGQSMCQSCQEEMRTHKKTAVIIKYEHPKSGEKSIVMISHAKEVNDDKIIRVFQTKMESRGLKNVRVKQLQFIPVL